MQAKKSSNDTQTELEIKWLKRLFSDKKNNKGILIQIMCGMKNSIVQAQSPQEKQKHLKIFFTNGIQTVILLYMKMV